MAMSVIQVRLPDTIISLLERYVKDGLYSNKSDVIRDAVRRLMIDRQIGSIPDTGDSVKEVRAIRKILSKQVKSFKDLEEINKLCD